MTAKERPGDRPIFRVDWMEAHDLLKTARRARDVLWAKKPNGDALYPDLTIIADETAVGRPGMDSLTTRIGLTPVGFHVSGTVTRDPSEKDQLEHLAPIDLVGMLQSVTSHKRLQVPLDCPERADLQNEMAALEQDGETVKGHEAIRVRTVGLGIWWCARALGDSFQADMPPSDDPMAIDLQGQKDMQASMADDLGLTEDEIDM